MQALPGQTTPEGVPAFKLVLVGDGGTGTPRPPLPSTYGVFLHILMLNAVITPIALSFTIPACHTGKTTFVKRHLTGEFEKKYERKFCTHLQP